MKSLRLRQLLFVCVAMLLTLMPTGAAQATPPDQYIYHSEVDWSWIDCGDFMVNEHAVMDVRVREHYDKDGNWVRAVEHYDWNGIVYNNQHPEIFLVEKPTHYNVTYYPDGLQAWVGLIISIHVPGEGPVFRGAGRGALYWLDDGYDLVYYMGHNDWIEGNTDALCAALRAP